MREVLVKTEEFKDSPLGKIPKDWEVCPIENKLQKIIDYRGKTPEKTNYGVPLITAKNVRDGYLDPEPREYIDEKNYDIWMRRGFPKAEDVLFTTEAPLGNIARVPNYKIALAQRLLTLSASPEELDAGYLFWFLNWSESRRRLEQKSTGSTVLGIKQSVFRKILFRFPPLPEQRCIAEILDTVDKAIARTSSLIIKLKQTKAGLLQDLLTRGLDEDGKLRDSEAHPELFKDSPLGQIPKDWQSPTFEEVTVDDAPICYGIVQPGTYVDSGVPVIAIQNLNTDYQNNIHKSAQIIENRYIRSRVIHNDVLISVKGTIGRVGIVPFWFKGNISRDVARIRLKSCALPTYVRQMLLAPSSQKWLEKAVVGTTRAEISIGILKKLRLLLPPKSEQEFIADILETHDNCICTEEAYLKKLKLQKHGLMQDLLTGKVRVKTIK